MSQLIENIRHDYGFDIEVEQDQARRALENLRDNMQHALCSLSEDLYSKDTHFVLEFIQNADDNSYAADVKPYVVFYLDTQEGMLDIFCNEEGFSAANVRAICSVGKSTKKNQAGYIGEKGIGFKSVFKVADVVHISSKEYTFKFDKSQDLGMILPIWTEDYPTQEGWTRFHLALSEDISLAALAERLREIEPSLLLFLRKLRRIKISVDGDMRSFSSSPTQEEENITRLTRKEGKSLQDQDYVIVKKKTKTYTEELKREGIKDSEIVLAFPVSEKRDPVIADQPVHAFLPIRIYQVPFMIQADFLLAANREDILVDSQWNVVLRDAIAPVFCAAVSQHFSKISGLKFNWLRYIPKHFSDPFFGNLRHSIIQALSTRRCLLCSDGHYRIPSEVIILDDIHRDKSGAPLIDLQYLPGQYYLHRMYHLGRDRSILQEIGTKALTHEALLAGVQCMNNAGVLTEQEDHWFECLSAALQHHLSYLRYDKHTTFLSALKKLPLVPLKDGSYTVASNSNLLFDMKVTNIPRDLGILLVDPPAQSSYYYSLLVTLGVQEAKASVIADIITELHTLGPGNFSDVDALPSHALFLFHHSHTVHSDFYVLTAEGKAVLSKRVYMCDEDTAHPSLQRFVDMTEVDILHAQYYEAIDVKNRENWLHWLRDRLQINITPRIEPNGNLSNEFSLFIRHATTKTFLSTLRHFWPALQGRLRRTGMDSLRAVLVICADKSKRRIDSTFIKRGALRKMDDLPFLRLASPDDAGWDFLAQLGVSLSADAISYLKLLERLRDGDRRPSRAEVEEIYHQLEARFDEGHEAEIRERFREIPLIWVPPDNPYKGPIDRNGWIYFDNTARDGPRSMQTKLNILKTYPSLTKMPVLEKSGLSVKDRCRRLYTLLGDVCDAILDSRDEETEPDWLSDLVRLHIFPVHLSSGKLLFKSVNGQFFIPDASSELADLFRDSCRILHCPKEFPLLRWKPLLESSPCVKQIKELVDSVDSEIDVKGERILNKIESRQHSSRIHHLRRLLNAKGTELKNIPTKFRVYNVDSIQYIYSFGQLQKKRNQEVYVELDSEARSIDVFILHGAAEDDYLIPMVKELADCFGNLSSEDVSPILTMRTTLLDKYLDSIGVPQIPYEDPPRERFRRRRRIRGRL
ncbi:hypothetical protein NM688_g2983 [Phlebia brevispora]|uniref:Uncharacterized protein n=1 Tax=Phlebia brevispora TaxID=194682 RepID=A0ACC1T7P8_9APHY|nr:hypothetical protein NM688_g2983 [Phlebia brevispora]